jgi:hypothetical protein
MKTRNGVYYDLTASTYKFKAPDTKLIFVFSSDLHMLKFEDQYLANRKDFNLKLHSRFRVNIVTRNLPDIVLYKKIETRGFLLINGEGEKICLENLKLDGEKVTKKS